MWILISVLLSGCSSPPITTKTQYMYPPQAYLSPCQVSTFTGKTYGEAILHLITVTAERDVCASQIRHINQWIQQTKGEQQ